jgi:hypothetical protein
MSGDWWGTFWTLLVTFCIVIIGYTETFWSPRVSSCPYAFRCFINTIFRELQTNCSTWTDAMQQKLTCVSINPVQYKLTGNQVWESSTKLRKKNISFVCVRSLAWKKKTGSHETDFREMWYLSIFFFEKDCTEISSFINTLRPAAI